MDIYTLRNTNGMEARIMTYGGVLVSLKVPDRSGNLGDVVLGFDSLDGYLHDAAASPTSALVDRPVWQPHRQKPSSPLDGVTYHLAPTNNGPNTLHGGNKGFDKVVWKAKAVQGDLGPSLELTYVSKDGEEGYPGTLKVKAVYTVTEENGLRLEFTATTDKDTVVNLTHHSYWNLAGKGNILDQVLTIDADKYTPVNDTLIPTWECWNPWTARHLTSAT